MTNLNTRYALLLTLLVVMLPHASRVPLWLNGAFIVSLLWRLPVIEQRLPLPNKWFKVLFVMGALASIKYSYNTWFGPEAGTSFLIVCIALKLLETKNERDCYVLLTLSYFMLATQFLFNQGLASTLYAGLGVLCITAAYVVFNQTISLKHAFKKITDIIGAGIAFNVDFVFVFSKIATIMDF